MSTVRKRPKYAILDNGLTIPYDFQKEFARSTTYVPESGDVFICTYPKCGTTWMQNILHLMLTGGQPLAPRQKICDLVPHLEDQGKEFVEGLPRPRVIKTHLPYSMLPKSGQAKYIFVARNPKDCCVSFYFHTRRFATNYDYADGTLEDYFELFLAGEVDYGDYFDWVLDYMEHKGDLDMLFLLYEEMKEDTRGSILKIGQFLGQPFLGACEDPSVLDRIVHNSSFKAMKTTPTNWCSEQSEEAPSFIRKGVVGDWRNHLSEDQSRRMDEKFRSKFGGTDAEHLWDGFDC